MAAQTLHAGACFIPFYELNEGNPNRPVLKHWSPKATGRHWEDWAIGEAYANHFCPCLMHGEVNEAALVQIVSDMGNFMSKSDWCAIGFLDQIGRRLKRSA